jgi:hypothetical protein
MVQLDRWRQQGPATIVVCVEAEAVNDDFDDKSAEHTSSRPRIIGAVLDAGRGLGDASP